VEQIAAAPFGRIGTCRGPRNLSRCIGLCSGEAPHIVLPTIHLVVAPFANSGSL
jgi:hypothetical protein